MKVNSFSYHYRYNLKLALPIVFSHLGHMLTGLADSLMVGHVGTVPLAAASLANSVFMLALVFGIGICFGVTPMVAAADGKKVYSQMSAILTNSLVLFTGIGLILFLLMVPLSGVIQYLNQPPDVVALAVPYFNILAFSMIPLMVFMTLKQYTEGLSLTRQAMYISLAGNLLNIILNYIFIFGKLDVPAMGLNGAGWATFLARVFMAVAMIGFIYMPSVAEKYNIRINLKSLSKQLMRRIFSMGFTISMQMTLEVGAFVFAAIMIGWMGAQELAAHQIAISLAATTYMVANGFASAGTVRVGNQYGLENFRELRRAGFSIYHMVIIFMSLSAVGFILLRHVLPTFFVDDGAVIVIASNLLIIAALFQLGDGLQAVGMGVLRGMEDVNKPTLIALLSYWLVGLTCGYYLGFIQGFGVVGMWTGLMIGLNTAAILLTWRFHSLTKHLQLQIRKQ